MSTIVFVAGYGDSLGEHWQRRWFEELRASAAPHAPSAVWVEQPDWEGPDSADWVASLARTLDEIPDGDPVDLVAHSLGVLTVVRWAAAGPAAAARVRVALLVAAPDPHLPSFPPSLRWGSPELLPLPFAATLVASSDDPYATAERSREYAQAWGADLVELGPAGHVNVASGFGYWPQGPALLAAAAARRKDNDYIDK